MTAPWPKVIQDHLNNCGALILIVSENSFDSEWVQKEVARAKRIGKPVFPILLNGNLWPSVELTQGMDTANKELLPEKFYEQLALVSPREEHPAEETLTNAKPLKVPRMKRPSLTLSRCGGGLLRSSARLESESCYGSTEHFNPQPFPRRLQFLLRHLILRRRNFHSDEGGHTTPRISSSTLTAIANQKLDDPCACRKFHHGQ